MRLVDRGVVSVPALGAPRVVVPATRAPHFLHTLQLGCTKY
jgi:hypothetical protein